MILWWSSLSVAMKVLWGVTLTASLIFLIQSILTFIGIDGGDSDFDSVDSDIPDGDIHGGLDGMNLYTFRNLVNFLLGFGWSAILLQDSIDSVFVLMLVSILVGIALVAIVMYMFSLIARMQQSGNIDLPKQAPGCQGTVYLTVPGARAGEGKVQISINNSIREYNAQTEGETLKTGTPIKVVDVINASTVLIEGLDSYTI